jgi:hypothetical protein
VLERNADTPNLSSSRPADASNFWLRRLSVYCFLMAERSSFRYSVGFLLDLFYDDHLPDYFEQGQAFVDLGFGQDTLKRPSQPKEMVSEMALPRVSCANRQRRYNH